MRGDVAMYAFTGTPQPVEVHYRGTWYRGELLGWRNEPNGGCLARVRCIVGTLRHSTWVSFADLRLPEPDALSVENPPVDLSPAVRVPARRAPALALPAAPAVPAAPVTPAAEQDDETRPHELLPGRARRRPPVPRTTGRPLPPPRAYQQYDPQYYRRQERQQSCSHA